MNCRYCGQWNPDEAARCSFCANAKDALEDASVEPRRTHPHVTLPAAVGKEQLSARREEGPPNLLRVRGPEPEFRRALRHAEYASLIIGGIIAALVGFLYVLGRCS